MGVVSEAGPAPAFQWLFLLKFRDKRVQEAKTVCDLFYHPNPKLQSEYSPVSENWNNPQVTLLSIVTTTHHNHIALSWVFLTFVTCSTKVTEFYIASNKCCGGLGMGLAVKPFQCDYWEITFSHSRHNPENFIPCRGIFQTRLLMHDSNYEALTQKEEGGRRRTWREMGGGKEVMYVTACVEDGSRRGGEKERGWRRMRMIFPSICLFIHH